MAQGFLLRCSPAEGRFDATSGPGGDRVEGEGCVVLAAGPVDVAAVLERHLAGGPLDAPDRPAAIAVWDARSRSLQLIRDRTGLYSLFHARTGRDLVAGPDARAVVGADGVARELDPLTLAAWLAGVDGEPEQTLFRDVRRVPAGHMLVAGPEGERIRRLWEPPAEGSLAPAEAAAFGEVLENAISRSLDGRVGIFLSGGIDSSAVATAAAAACREADVESPLALCVHIEGASEEHAQRRVSSALGLERRTRVARSGEGLLGRALDRAAESLWPVGSPWQPVFDDLAVEANTAGVKAVLDGIGGDDLLDAALRPARDALRHGRLGVLRDLAAAERGYTGGGMVSVLRAALPRPRGWQPPPFIASRHRGALKDLAAERRDDLLSTRLAAGWEETWDAGVRQGVAYRHPLWDAAVVELVRGLPAESLVANGEAKSPARAYLRASLPSLSGRWPRPEVADSLLASLAREYETAERHALRLPCLEELGVVHPPGLLGGFQIPAMTAMLTCEHWIRSTQQWGAE